MRKILVRFTLLLLLVGACSAGWFYRGQIVSLVEAAIGSSTTSGPAPDPKTYSVLSESLEEHRRRLSADYRRTTSTTERMEILAQARKLLELSLPRLMRCWLGTPWDFNGIASSCGIMIPAFLRDKTNHSFRNPFCEMIAKLPTPRKAVNEKWNKFQFIVVEQNSKRIHGSNYCITNTSIHMHIENMGTHECKILSACQCLVS